MLSMKRGLRDALSALATAAILGGSASAGPFDPLAFVSQGTFAGTGTWDLFEGNHGYSGTPVATLSNGTTTYNGVISNGVAVFDFDSMSLAPGSSITAFVYATNSVLPVAFLSRGDVNIGGTINISGGTDNLFPSTGPGGGVGGSVTPILDPAGPGAGGFNTLRNPTGGGGGGFGGNGGAGGASTGGGGNAGGLAYGNLALALQGGSGGGFGGTTFNTGPTSGVGGGSGGAIEIGATRQAYDRRHDQRQWPGWNGRSEQ